MQKAFVNSLPKSGTNLVIKALEMMGMREEFYLSAGLVRGRNLASFVRRVLWYPLGSSYLVGIDTPVAMARWPVDARLRRIAPGSFGSGHLGYDSLLLDEVKRLGIRPILMTRDPRAVLVSGIEYVLQQSAHVLHRGFSRLDRREQIERMLAGGAVGGVELKPLRTRCEALAPWASDAAVLWLKFEDLVGSRGGGDDVRQRSSLLALAEFVGVATQTVDEVAAGLWGPGRSTFHKGTAQGWREAIPPDMLARVNEQLQPVLEAWGYPS